MDKNIFLIFSREVFKFLNNLDLANKLEIIESSEVNYKFVIIINKIRIRGTNIYVEEMKKVIEILKEINE